MIVYTSLRASGRSPRGAFVAGIHQLGWRGPGGVLRLWVRIATTRDKEGNQMPATGQARRDFQVARNILEMPTGGFVDVGVTEVGQVKVVLTGAYNIESMFRGRQHTESTVVILVPEPPKRRRRR